MPINVTFGIQKHIVFSSIVIYASYFKSKGVGLVTTHSSIFTYL